MGKSHLTIVNIVGCLSMIKTVPITNVGAAAAVPMMRSLMKNTEIEMPLID